MARRKVFNKQKPQTLSFLARTDGDIAIVERFRRHCDQRGVSVRQGLLTLLLNYLNG